MKKSKSVQFFRGRALEVPVYLFRLFPPGSYRDIVVLAFLVRRVIDLAAEDNWDGWFHCPARSLARYGIKPHTATRALDALEQKGFVSRTKAKGRCMVRVDLDAIEKGRKKSRWHLVRPAWSR